MQVVVESEAATPPIDLTTAQATEIADYLRPRLKDSDTASFFECPFNGTVWLDTLHFLPQAFVQSSRRAAQPAKEDKFTEHFNNKLGDLFPMTPVGVERPMGQRLRKRTDLYATVWRMISQEEWKPMGYVTAVQAMLARVATTHDFAEKTRQLDWWRFTVNPYSIGAAVRGKLMETIMNEIRQALSRCSGEDYRSITVVLEFLATAVYSLHALLLYNDRECDTESINEETRWPANVGLKTLASIGQIVSQIVVKEYMAGYPQHAPVLNLQSAVAAFLARLSWNNDNKALLYQTMDGALLRAILRWASEEDFNKQVRLAGFVRSGSSEHESKDGVSDTIRTVARVHCATTIWNISKVSGNVTRLVADRKLFVKVLRMAVRQREQPAVLRRILSCVQNLASERTMLISMLDQQQAAGWRGVGGALAPAARRQSLDHDEIRTVTDHTEETAMVESFQSVADFLEGLFEHVSGSDHVAAQVLATIANFAYTGAVGNASLIASELRRFLGMEGETSSVNDFFKLSGLDEKLEFRQSSVKYEIARLLWCSLRMGNEMYPRSPFSHDLIQADERRLLNLVCELDVRCASVGVIYDDVPRREVHSDEIDDLFSVLQYDDFQPQGRKRSPVIRLFAAWQLAHFSEMPADATKLASLGGFDTLATVARRIVDRLVEPTSIGRSPSAAEPVQTGHCYLLTLKLLLHCLKNIAKEGDKLAHTIRGTDVLRNLASVFEHIPTLQDMELGLHTQPPRDAAVFFGRMGYKWFPLVDSKKSNLAGQEVAITPLLTLPQPSTAAKTQGMLDVKAFDGSAKLRSLPVFEYDVRKSALPSDIDMRRHVGSIFESMARHQEVLESLEPSNALEPFVELAIDGVVSLKICLLALMRLHPSALYRPTTLAKMQQLLEYILGADISFSDSAASSPVPVSRTHHSSSSGIDIRSELSVNDFGGTPTRPSRISMLSAQVDLPTSILALRLANYVVSVFPEALHNLMTRTNFTPVERVQHRRLRRRLSRVGFVVRQTTPDSHDESLAVELGTQGQILAIAALCRPLFSEALFVKFDKTLFLGKAEGRDDMQMRLLHEWQYFFLELCGTVCDSLRRAGRVAGIEGDESLLNRGHDLPRADEAGELLTAEHFIAVKHMVDLCQRCFQHVTGASSPTGSEDVLKVAFRCLGAAVSLVEYVGSRNTSPSDDITDRGSLVSNHDDTAERAGILALVAPAMTSLYGVGGALRTCWHMLKKGTDNKFISPLIFDHVLPIVLQFIRSSEALDVQEIEKKFSEDVRSILGTTIQIILLLQPDAMSAEGNTCKPTGHENILANALRLLIAIVESNAVKNVASQFSSNLTSVVNCLAYPANNIFLSEVMRMLAEERQGHGHGHAVVLPPQLLRGPSTNSVQGHVARIMEMFRRYPLCRTARVLTAKLLSLLARDVGTARQAVFPDEVSEGRTPRTEDESVGDVDVSHRSWRGCIPLLWAMLRFGNVQEQEEALFVLYQLTQNNNLMKEVIGVIDDVKTLMRVGRSSEQAPALKCQLSKMLYELSSHPQLRQQMRRDGGLLLILQLNRSQDQEVRQFAELALQNFGKNSLEIHIQLLSSSVRYIDRLIHISPNTQKRSVGLMLLQPIHNIQLKEAIHGLVECAKHQDYAASMVKMDFERSELEENAEEISLPRAPASPAPSLGRHSSLSIAPPSLMQLLQIVFHVRDGDIQRNLLRILRALLWNCGDEFVRSLTPEQSELLTHNLMWLLQPLSIRAARIIVNACKSNIQSNPRRVQLSNVLQRRMAGSRDQQQHRRSSTAVSVTYMSLSDDVEVPMAASERVALVYDAGILDTTRLAAECIQIWAAQKVSVAISFARKGLFDVIGQNLANADLWDIHLTLGDATIEDSNAPGRKSTFVDSIVQLQITLIRTIVQVKLSLCGLGSDEYDGQLLRALVFIHTYHFNESVQREAFQALMLANVPMMLVPPRVWGESDVLRWLCNTGLFQLAARLIDELQFQRQQIQSKDMSEVSRRIAKGSASGRWFYTIQKLLQDSGWSTDNRTAVETVAGNLLLNLNHDLVCGSRIQATEQQARDFMANLRLLHLQQLAFESGFLFTDSSNIITLGGSGGEMTESRMADSSLATTGSRPHYITMQQRQVLMRLAQSVLNNFGYNTIGRDAWTAWWGMHYCGGWCFEACLPSGQSVTLRMVRLGTKPPLPVFASDFVRHPPLPVEVERSLAAHGLAVQVLFGSMVHHVLLEHVQHVLQRQGLEQEFTLLRAPPAPKLRFWRVEAQDNRRGRKVVLLEPSASLDKTNREQQDPDDYACSVIEIIPDVKHTSNIFVLDVVDMTNERDKDGCTSLIRAVMKNNMELARKLLEDPNVDPRVRDNEGRTALLHAVLLKHDDILTLLLNYLANIQRRSKQDGTSSIVAASYQRSIDECDNYGRAALHHAVADKEERLNVVKQLLQAKAQVNVRDNEGNTPLHLACQYGHVDVVKNLLKYNANTTAANTTLQTPVHVAAGHLQTRIVAILLKENSEHMIRAEDSAGATALHYAVKAGQKLQQERDDAAQDEGEEEVVRMLLRHGADLHDLDKDGRTPLDFRLYYHQKYQQIREAVVVDLEYTIKQVTRVAEHVWNYPRFVFVDGCRGGRLRYETLEQREEERRFQRLADKTRASERLFASTRIQEAVDVEWRHGGCRRSALKSFLFYCFYLLIFTLSTIYSTGQNKPHGYYMTEGVRQILLQNPINSAQSPNPVFADINTLSGIWQWAEGPLLQALTQGSNVTWYSGDEERSFENGYYMNGLDKVVGKIRFSQWRTSDKSCTVSEEFDEDLEPCFAEYCPEGETCFPTEDKKDFGPNQMFHFEKGVHYQSIPGRFATYSTDCFVEEISQNPQEAQMQLQALQDNNWIDAGTRAVAVEMSVYSPPSNRFVYIQLMFEIPAATGVVPLDTVFTFQGFAPLADLSNVQSYEDLVSAILDIVFVVCVAVYILVEIKDCVQSYPYYFLNVYNYVDWLLITFHIAAFSLTSSFATDLGQLDFTDNDRFLDIRSVVEAEQWRRLIVSCALILAWFKLLEPTQLLVAEFFILVKMIVLMLSKLLQSYAPLLAIVFLAWTFARYSLLSQLELTHSTLAFTFATQYPEAMGEFTLQDVTDTFIYQKWRLAAMTVFIVITVLVMLNLLISLLNDLYEKLKQKAKADWCRQQAIQLYQRDERKQHGARQWLKTLWQNGAASHDAAGSPTHGTKPSEHVNDDAELEFGLSPALSISIAGGSARDGGMPSVTEESEGDPLDVHPTRRLQRLQERAARVGRAFFDDDRRMHAIGPLLRSLKAWSINAYAPPLELLGVLDQLLKETARNPARLREFLHEGALRTVTVVLEAIENHKLGQPDHAKSPIHDAWRTAQRVCLRCMYRLTLLPSETAATTEFNTAEWSSQLHNAWGGAEATHLLTQLLLNDLANNRGTGTSAHKAGRARIKQAEYQLEVLQAMGNMLDAELVASKTRHSVMQSSAIQPHVAAIILRFAANEVLDDLHRDLALAATKIAAKYCMYQLAEDLQRLEHLSTPDAFEEEHWRCLQAVAICKRLADMGQQGVDAILNNAQVLLALVEGLRHVVSTAAASRSKTENSVAQRITRTLLMVTQHSQISGEGTIGLTNQHLKVLVQVFMQVVESEVRAEQEDSAIQASDRRNTLPVDDEGDIAIAAIEALGNLLQAYDTFASAAGHAHENFVKDQMQACTTAYPVFVSMVNGSFIENGAAHIRTKHQPENFLSPDLLFADTDSMNDDDEPSQLPAQHLAGYRTFASTHNLTALSRQGSSHPSEAGNRSRTASASSNWRLRASEHAGGVELTGFGEQKSGFV